MKLDRRLITMAAAAALVAAGCGAQKNSLLAPTQAPEVELFAQRVDHSKAGPFTYRFQWAASAAGGRIDHFLYSFGSPADDPRRATWTTTPAREHVLSFRGRGRDDGDDEEECGKIEPRIFSLRAVDATGSVSPPARVAVFNGTIAPHVEITTPAPSPLVRYYLGPTVCVAWRGTAADDEGVVSPEGVARYKYKLLTETTEVSLHTARSDPDSVRRYYAPRGWQGWESTPGNVTGTVLRDLAPDREYVFVVTCFDECGNYDPIFSYSTNMLYLRIVAGGPPPPMLTITQDNYVVYSGRGKDPTNIVNMEIPPGPSITFRWSATAEPGREITGYRWALNLPNRPEHDPEDDPRAGDTRARREGGWTRWSLTNTSATLGPFTGGGVHALTVEARDNSGCDEDRSRVTRATIRLIVVQPTYTRQLLIVDDTRLLLDRINMGTACDHSSNRPIGNWPTAAELDTFLYASGGVPWRCYPAGTRSTPGIFSGYDFDTLGTRLGIQDLTIRLSTLSRYRHVVWLVDAAGAGRTGPGYDLAESQTSMRYMNNIGMTNTLAAYVRQGGKVWIAGGGSATAALINFNRQTNDNATPIPRTLTFSNGAGELVPGRFIYDQAHWRSEFKQHRVNGGRIRRHLGRLDPGVGGNPGAYAGLPVEIQLKSPATDPFPPNRTGQSQSVFYQTQFDIEFLSAANEILEDQDSRPGHEDIQPTLDSLYKVTASTLLPDTGPGALQSVVMTYYHGQESAPFVHTGFSLWSYRRSHCAALVDFVLQQLWGMTRQGQVAGPVLVEEVKAGTPTGRLSRPREGPVSAAAPATGRGK